MGLIQKIFRWLNESAYLVSVPFIIILLFGIAVKAYPIAIFGATFVVLLNIGRIVAGVANLAVIPLRDGLNLKKFKKPIRRVIEPVVTIVLVVLAFTFIPWLSNGKASTGNDLRSHSLDGRSAQEGHQGRGRQGRRQGQGPELDKLARRHRASSRGWSTRPGHDLNKLGLSAGREVEARSPTAGTARRRSRDRPRHRVGELHQGRAARPRGRSKNCRKSLDGA